MRRGEEGVDRMPCESCGVQFSVFRRRRVCSECDRYYCSGCLRRGGGICAPCRVLSTRPLIHSHIVHLKVRDLQSFLQRHNISTRGCFEKEDLVSLCISYVNSSSYRRRGPRTTTFSTLKGFTNNINEFINSALDLRQGPQRSPSGGCFNPNHSHSHSAGMGAGSIERDPQPPSERFTLAPGGERDVREEAVPPAASAVSSSASDGDEERVESADCFEVEDLDESGWELVNPPAEPLPNDSEVLIVVPEEVLVTPPEPLRETSPARGPREELQADTPRRTASTLDLHHADGSPTYPEHDPDSISLQDESYESHHPPMVEPTTPRHLVLDQIESESDLEELSIRQLKELLVRNRVEIRGCVERADLLQRALMLYKDHNKFHKDIDKLPLEECCKICMAAPLECVLLECGHIAACTHCAKQLAECPICRQYVVRAVRCFRS